MTKLKDDIIQSRNIQEVLYQSGLHQGSRHLLEYKRTTVDTSTDGNLIQGYQYTDSGLGRESLLKKLGCSFQVYPENGSHFFRIVALGDAEKLAEEASISADTTFTSNTYGDRKRYQCHIPVSKELIAQLGSNPALIDTIDREAKKSIDRQVFQTLVTQLEALTPKTGHATADGDLSATLGVMLDIEGDLSAQEGASLKWLGNSALKEALKAREISSGSGRMLWAFDQIADIDALGSQYLTAKHCVLGDFSRAVIEEPSHIERLVDPYTNSKKGIVDIIYFAHFGTYIVDSSAFVLSENLI
jgi:hypothetical protein